MPWKDDVASILLAFMPGQMYESAMCRALLLSMRMISTHSSLYPNLR